MFFGIQLQDVRVMLEHVRFPHIANADIAAWPAIGLKGCKAKNAEFPFIHRHLCSHVL